jgi:uncharacterized protein YcbX
LKRVSKIITYPIKSCRGVSVPFAEVTPTGLDHDRQFVLIDEHGKFLSQRRFPKMCLIQPRLETNCLVLSCPETSSLTFRIPLSSNEPIGHPTVPVDIWGKIGYGIDVGDFASEWFSDHLGVKCRLLEYDIRNPRKRHRVVAGDPIIPLSFADGFPILMISEESLADLNGRLQTPVTMDRFRPNIVVSGADYSFDEDEWKTVSIAGGRFFAGARFFGEKLCERCTIPLIDPRTGIPDDAEPLATLKTYRRIPSTPGGRIGPVCFGKNFSVKRSGRIFVSSVVIAT